MKTFSLSVLISTISTTLYSENTIGCSASAIYETSCSEESVLETKSFQLTTLQSDSIPSTSSPTKEIGINITPTLSSVELHYQNKQIVIKRIPQTQEQSCPPYCIQPMQIEKVKTVGELETLKFIRALEKKTGAFLVDGRTPSMYKKFSLPAATNIPYSLLASSGKHQENVLKLLGAQKINKTWHFNNVRELLIYDNGLWDFQASQLIKNLIELGYPQDHLFYYRGGIQSWKAAGLTLS